MSPVQWCGRSFTWQSIICVNYIYTLLLISGARKISCLYWNPWKNLTLNRLFVPSSWLYNQVPYTWYILRYYAPFPKLSSSLKVPTAFTELVIHCLFVFQRSHSWLLSRDHFPIKYWRTKINNIASPPIHRVNLLFVEWWEPINGDV